ncbi:MAG: NAD(P)H-hydrate epimerase [Tissierellia bacterium]|nr:NAD(P)H-hydrate epimerase [Tissierellia bacterium]
MRDITVTKEEMKRIERYAIDYYGISEIALMENAASKVVKNIKNVEIEKSNRYAIICGVGNNGADGLVVARHLLALDKMVDIYIIGDENKGSPLFKMNLEIIKKIKDEIKSLDVIGELQDLRTNLNKATTIIDAITGTGFEGSFDGNIDYVIETINDSNRYIISIDMPSGMDANSGNVSTVCVMPDLIVTLCI